MNIRRNIHVAIAAGVMLLAAAGIARAAEPPPIDNPATCRRVGGRFEQPEPLTIGFKDWFYRTLTSRRGPWSNFTGAAPGPPPPKRVDGGDLRVTLVNHATVLIQLDGINVLTDPTWAERSVPIVGVRRRRPPGLRFEDLPPIDVVLVSHNHQDHMDLPTLHRLSQTHHPAIYSGLGNGAFLAHHSVPGGIDLDWWQTVDIGPGLTLTAVPARHWSGRGLLDHDRTLWCGFVLTGPSGSVYFAGDTGWGTHFAQIGARFPRLRLALLPIGGFKPVWYMRERHLGPSDALRAHRALGASTTVPMHFGTFPNGDDAETEPIEALHATLAANPDVACDVVTLTNGQSLDVPPFHRAQGGPPQRIAAGR